MVVYKSLSRKHVIREQQLTAGTNEKTHFGGVSLSASIIIMIIIIIIIMIIYSICIIIIIINIIIISSSSSSVVSSINILSISISCKASGCVSPRASLRPRVAVKWVPEEGGTL